MGILTSKTVSVVVKWGFWLQSGLIWGGGVRLFRVLAMLRAFKRQPFFLSHTASARGAYCRQAVAVAMAFVEW